MNQVIALGNRLQDLLDKLRTLDFLAPLLLRLYLVPVFLVAGVKKLESPENTIAWFDKVLNLPLPTLMYWLASLTEAVGAVLLLLGLATRWISIPLMFTMIVAAGTVHLKYGWLAVGTSDTSSYNVLISADKASPIGERVQPGRAILREHGNYEWLTEYGSFVVLNNGIEFAATYFLMLLALFFIGGGRFCSLDYWIARALRE